METKKGFTLVELLIVIGILAILSTAAVLVINPAQLLAQSRDSKRMSDITALNTALSLYLSDVSAPSLGTCTGAANAFGYSSGSAAPTNGSFTNAAVNTASTNTAVTGGGWIPVNFGSISSGSPLAALPLDPTNSGNTVYRYACSGTTYELNVQFESNKYLNATPGYSQNDGGNQNTCPATATCFYEVGNALAI